jgi:hypothetical protein
MPLGHYIAEYICECVYALSYVILILVSTTVNNKYNKSGSTNVDILTELPFNKPEEYL